MCPFTFYGQLAPTRVPEGLMLELEQEIFEPSGISTVVPPKMVLKGILISKSCGILYHIDECTGLRYRTSSRSHHSVPDKTLAHGSTIATSSNVCRRPLRYSTIQPNANVIDAGWSSIIHLVMLLLLSRQITTSRTPAGISRLSRWTFLAQALVDTITFVIVGVSNITHLAISITLGIPSLSASRTPLMLRPPSH